MENPIQKIREELFKNLVSFLNEIEISFDYIDSDTILKIKNYISEIEENDESFMNFIKFTYNHLHTFEKDFSFILFSNQKFKKEKLNFLNDILLYGDSNDNCLLKFKIFENENKNTKRSFVKYIYNIYLTTYFINNQHSDENILTEELNNFISNIIKESTPPDNTNSGKGTPIEKSKRKHRRVNAIDLNNNLPNGLSGMEQMMNSLMGNKDILNIATDISNQMKNENINPMSMLTGLMTGKMDKNLEKLVDRIQEKVETKINTGEINKEVFEEQAKNIINTVNNVDFKDLGIPSLNMAMNNLMKEFNNEELK